MSVIVLATANPFKVKEIVPLVQVAGYQVKLQTEFFSDEVEEDGLSFIENAIKKARFASAKTGLPALADDSGIQVDFLQGGPGIYSARFSETLGFDESSDELNMLNLVKQLEGLPLAERQANYICVSVYVENEDDETPIIGMGKWHGDILSEPRTSFGVGYDSVMWIPSELKTASEVPLARKLQISHRTQAINSVINQIRQKKVK